MPNLVYIKAFGMIAEKMGKSSFEVENPESTEALKRFLFDQYPELKSMKFGLAINKKMVQGDHKLEAEMEVAILPPFSGG